MRYYFTPIRITKKKKVRTLNAAEDAEKWNHSFPGAVC